MKPMTLREAYLTGLRLLGQAGVDCPRMDAAQLLERATGDGAARLSGHLIPEDAQKRYFSWIDRRCAGEPLQYILGQWEFYSLPMRVGPGVLIPRPETELLVQAGLSLIAKLPAPKVLDLCTGSGCIAAAVGVHRPDAEVTAADLFDAPLNQAAENFRALGLSEIQIRRVDARKLPPEEWENAFDLILCNPPYVTAAEMQSLQRELYFEPAEALLGGADGLDFYRSLAGQWHRAIRPGGWMGLEIGAAQGKAVVKLLEEHFEKILVQRDGAGHDRVITAARIPYHTI